MSDTLKISERDESQENSELADIKNALKGLE